MKKQFLLLTFISFFLLQSVNVLAIVPVKENNVPASVVSESVNQFNQLSKKEKKQRFGEVKKQLKLLKANKAQGKKGDDQQVLEIVLAILLPPVAVYLHEDAINTKFWISLVLTLLFWIPGVIYALLVVLDAI